MCLISFSWQPQSDQPLVLAANRDEFYHRPSAASHWWRDAPQVLAGRDLEAGGSWLGMTRHGRIAMLTNYRAPTERNPDARSRGHLVADFLRGSDSPRQYLEQLLPRLGRYNGFNLIVGQLFGAGGEPGALWVLESRGTAGIRPVSPGSHGLSNALLDTPWPKTRRLVSNVSLLAARRAELDAYLEALSCEQTAADIDLPDTGVGLAWERRLSSIFIRSADYGTRAQTVLRVQASGRVDWVERGFTRATAGTVTPCHETCESFQLELEQPQSLPV